MVRDHVHRQPRRLARSPRRRHAFGAFLDPVADKLIVIGGLGGAGRPRRLPLVAGVVDRRARSSASRSTDRSPAAAASCCRRRGSASTRRSRSTSRSARRAPAHGADWIGVQKSCARRRSDPHGHVGPADPQPRLHRLATPRARARLTKKRTGVTWPLYARPTHASSEGVRRFGRDSGHDDRDRALGDRESVAGCEPGGGRDAGAAGGLTLLFDAGARGEHAARGRGRPACDARRGDAHASPQRSHLRSQRRGHHGLGHEPRPEGVGAVRSAGHAAGGRRDDRDARPRRRLPARAPRRPQLGPATRGDRAEPRRRVREERRTDRRGGH